MGTKPIYDLRDERTLNNIVEVVESADNLKRLEKHLKDYEIVYGNQKDHILRALQLRYPETYDAMTVIDIAISRKIIRKLSRVYAAGVNRQVIDKKTGEENKALSELVNYIYADVDDNNVSYDSNMAMANELYSNHRYVEFFTYLDEGYRLRFKPLPQNLFTAMPNKDKTSAEVIIFKHSLADWGLFFNYIDWDNALTDIENVETLGIYTVWSKDYNFTFARVKGNKPLNEDEVLLENNDNIVFKYVVTKADEDREFNNPYGFMPFTAIKQETSGHFYPYGSEIARMGKEINVILSDLVSIAAQQGYGQAVIYFDGEKPPAITKTGPTHVINIPNKTGNSKFEFANPNPDLQGHLEIALALTRLTLTTNDLTTDKVSGELNATNFASAIDRLIADSETIENIEDQRKRYIAVEQNQFAITLKFLKYLQEHNVMPEDYPKVKLSELDLSKFKLKLTFNTIKPLTTESEKAKTIKQLEEDGFILPYEKHMRFNEKMNEKEAMAREKKIMEAKKEKAKEMFDMQVNKVNEELQDARKTEQENRPFGINQRGQERPRKPFPANGRRQEEIGQRGNRENQGTDKKRNRG